MKVEDYSKYLSIDNGHGLLIKRNDAMVMDSYDIDYHNCSNVSDLIMIIDKYMDDCYDSDIDDLEEVISNLMEQHYYNETNK